MTIPKTYLMLHYEQQRNKTNFLRILALETGTSFSTVRNYCYGLTKPNSDNVLRALSRCTGIKESELFKIAENDC